MACEENPCPPQSPSVFDRVHVSYIVRGGTTVIWDLLPTFSDPLPWVFTLQAGLSGNPAADDWQDVGLPVENVCYAVDGEQRAWGKTNIVHYRVKLETPNKLYYSDPTGGLGVLDTNGWKIAREIARKERLRHHQATCQGWLLKQRRSGAACHCRDFQTEEVRDPNCPTCWGTGYQCGYFRPMDCVWADLAPRTRRKHLDDQGERGVISNITVAARMLQVPLLSEYDVWVNDRTDDRYYIHSIENIAEVRGVPVIANVELRPAPFTDVVYSIPIPRG